MAGFFVIWSGNGGGPIFNDHKNFQNHFRKWGQEIREGKGYLYSLLDTLYAKVQKSKGQPSWLFLG